jgi:hypothetical protein
MARAGFGAWAYGQQWKAWFPKGAWSYYMSRPRESRRSGESLHVFEELLAQAMDGRQDAGHAGGRSQEAQSAVPERRAGAAWL